MTLPKLSLLPTSHDDRLAMLGALELVSGGDFEFLQRGRAEIGQRMTLEPGPQVLDRIQLGRVGGQSRDQDFTLCGVNIVGHDAAAVRFGTIPKYEQPAAQVALECFEEFHCTFTDRKSTRLNSSH